MGTSRWFRAGLRCSRRLGSVRLALHLGLVAAAVASLCAAAPIAAQISAPVEVRIPMPPSPVLADGKVHLVYEVHVTDYAPVAVTLTRVQTLVAGKPVMDLAGEELRSDSRWLGRTDAGPGDAAVEIAAGGTLVVFAWVEVEPAAVPSALEHRLSFRWVSSSGETQNVDLEPGPVRVGPPAVMISPPMRGEHFLAANGPDNASGHRRALIPIDGGARIAQRFATDWVQVIDDATHDGDPKDNSTYHIWGTEALAVADGTVVEIKDGIPENVPGLESRAVPITLETVGGNHVILDLGGGNFAFYAHLQPGSLRVSLGDRVKRGAVVGLVGNSGNSTEPHLHFHVANGPSPLGAQGVPFVFDRFVVTGRAAALGAKVEAVAAQEHRRETPLANVLVSFGPP